MLFWAMSKGMNPLHIFIILAFALMPAFSASAQVDDLVHTGDSLYKVYHFDEAVAAYNKALVKATSKDSKTPPSVLNKISDRVQVAQNASQMAQSVRTPNVVGRKKLSIDDCFLYLSLEDRSWRRLPNQLDSDIDDRYVRALFASDWSDRLYFSADDGTGTRSIFMTEYRDGVWSVKREVKEVSSAGVNEIYPILSPDEKTLYFSSDAPGGLGGYDLYVSRWDDLQECWTTPQNMGIPFSSPDDDFLFVDSEDERYSMFVSTRGCAKDSVWVYALEYDRDPVYSYIKDPEKLYTISRLVYNREETAVEEAKSGKSKNLAARYAAQAEQVRILKDSIAFVREQLDELVQEESFSNDDSRRYELRGQIEKKEKSISDLEKDLNAANERLAEIQSEFIHIDESPGSDNDSDDFLQYDFVKRSFGSPLELDLAVPDEQFNYTFRILKEAVFAEDQTLPSGIVYQIELFGSGRKAMLSELKGLSPVYEYLSPSGMRVYRVGCFSTFDEAEANVQTVRDLGFLRPHVCAFENGVEIPVKKARTLQERLKGGFGLYEIYITPDSGELDSNVADSIRSAAVGKDIVRTEKDDGTQIYTVGPFDSKKDAEDLVNVIKKIMTGKVVCEPINN
jgi:hypothetical protein